MTRKNYKHVKKNNKKIYTKKGGMVASYPAYGIKEPDSEYDCCNTLRTSELTNAKIRDIPILRIYLTRKIFNLNQENCETLKDQQRPCITPNSKSGQQIDICERNVFKGPPANKDIKLVINNVPTCELCSIEVDPFTMNLLIQSIIKDIIIDEVKNSKALGEENIFTKNNLEISDKNIEHYETICRLKLPSNKNSYQLVSRKAVYCPNHDGECNKETENYGTLEDFLIKYPIKNKDSFDKEIFIKNINSWLITIFDTLDKLYKIMQFHHCDPKAAQILLVGNKDFTEAIVADLDKITFTLKINTNYYRIMLTAPEALGAETGLAISKALPSTWRGKINKQFHSANYMRHEFKPRSNCDFEKFGFLASICLLCPSLEIANRVKEIGIKLINNREFGLHEFNESLFNDTSQKMLDKKKTLSYPLSFVIEPKEIRYAKLKSYVVLETMPFLKINHVP